MISTPYSDSLAIDQLSQEYESFLFDYAPSKITLTRWWDSPDLLASTTSETASSAGQNIYQALEILTGLYTFKDYFQIANFLGRNLDLIPVLMDCYFQALKCFSSGEILILELFSDREGSSSELFVLIPTRQGVKEVRNCLKKLDEDWWIEASAATIGRLNIDVEYI